MTLNELELGRRGRVVAVEGAGPFRRRLLELGLLPGTEVVRTGQAPLGDPLAFRFRGSVLSLRTADASSVRIDPE